MQFSQRAVLCIWRTQHDTISFLMERNWYVTTVSKDWFYVLKFCQYICIECTPKIFQNKYNLISRYQLRIIYAKIFHQPIAFHNVAFIPADACKKYCLLWLIKLEM